MFGVQDGLLAEQDEELGLLLGGVTRLSAVARAMHEELSDQNECLEDLDQHTESVRGRLGYEV